ncbi:uncharacterized protein CLUP02_11531 [Colletotrichum lupini]|uniref:Uncharacterized protein n=1 Tax=Colletotrichum lupini TaxID=145971 RepID=A0A9Q8WKD7_9PEZI|nr:uncharacterized protein CLUP02_11531 [Colletotrichum lupini]UQC86032.1 hypothetical protein CLUP02_11531 [Colletotrichum lupini]
MRQNLDWLSLAKSFESLSCAKRYLDIQLSRLHQRAVRRVGHSTLGTLDSQCHFTASWRRRYNRRPTSILLRTSPVGSARRVVRLVLRKSSC